MGLIVFLIVVILYSCLLFTRIPKTMVKSVQLSFLPKPTIFVVQKVATPKNGAELHQKSIRAIGCILANNTILVHKLLESFISA